MSLVEIAVACGFSSASHFSASFEVSFGQSPKARRLQLRK
jgi:transcriptional regulator GlxA family with amidase domain